MSGFSNPLVAANGALVYPQIMSPNFDLANPAASPTPSWAILKNGLAYFFGLALSGGTITGPDYILNPTGFYFYSGIPALGNPPIAWITTAASDPFGNAIPGPVIGTKGGTGIFAALNAGFIQFGAPGVNAPGQIGLAALAGGDLSITSGKQTAGDTPAVVRVQSSAVTAASPQLDLLGAFLLARIGATVNMGLTATGGTTTDTLAVTSTSTFGAKETISAGGLAVTGGTTTDTLNVTSTSTLNAKETITAGGLAVTGGTTTDTLTVAGETTLTPQVMSGHPVIKQTDQSVITVTAIANAAITNAWPINGGDAQNGTVYEIECGGYGAQGSTQETLRMQLSFMGVNIGSDVLPAATIPVSAQFEWTFKGTVSVVSNGAAGKARAHGEFKIWEVNGPATAVMIIGQHSAIPPAADSTVNTTANQTVSLGASWGSATGAPTITGAWSTLARAGA